MNRIIKLLFLFSLSLCLLFSGCRRKPVEQVETLTEKQTEKQTEKETEKITEKQTEKETEKQTEKQTEKETEKASDLPSDSTSTLQTEKQTENTATGQITSGINNQTERKAVSDTTQTESEKNDSNTPKTTVSPTTPSTTTSGGTDMCPYCCGTFSTDIGADGSSEYSSHVAQEEAYISYMNSQGTPVTTTQGTTDNNYYDGGYSICPYCGGSFSTDATYGYSEYAQHVAAEEANVYSQQNIEYTQCPYCGLYIDPVSYQDHITYGY